MKVHRTELTPVSFLRRSAFVYPDRIAVVHGERRYSYRELGERSNRLASALTSAGLERGERVAFLCRLSASSACGVQLGLARPRGHPDSESIV